MNATLEIREGRYIAAIWFYGWTSGDWLASLWREGDGPWMLSYRFRYYRDDKAFDSEDEKSAYEATAPATLTEEQAMAMVDSVADVVALAKAPLVARDRLLVRSDDPVAVFEIIRARPWASVKPAPGMAQA